mmetsp:Transcript_78040/g.168756  ORF Transcript_78040/g.168756 Transcript_78040/m.168756 type:complete len:102 (-) Transcript_78040:20-325(-)
MSEAKETAASKNLKMLGVTEDEMKRTTAYRKMGLSEDDYQKANAILDGAKELEPADTRKEEKITGYNSVQLNRTKAINMMGTTEEEIDEARAKALADLGHK